MTRLESGRLRLLIARATGPEDASDESAKGNHRQFPSAFGKSLGTLPGGQLGILTSLLTNVMRAPGAGVAEIGGTFLSMMGGAPSSRGTVRTIWLGGSAVAEPMPGREQTGPRMNVEIDDLAETRLCNCG